MGKHTQLGPPKGVLQELRLKADDAFIGSLELGRHFGPKSILLLIYFRTTNHKRMRHVKKNFVHNSRKRQTYFLERVIGDLLVTFWT